MTRPDVSLQVRVYDRIRAGATSRAELAELLPDSDPLQIDRALRLLVAEGMAPDRDYGRPASLERYQYRRQQLQQQRERMLRGPRVNAEFAARGDAVRRARQDRGWSQRQLARAIVAVEGGGASGIQSMISRLERGRELVPAWLLRAAERVLQLDGAS